MQVSLLSGVFDEEVKTSTDSAHLAGLLIIMDHLADPLITIGNVT